MLIVTLMALGILGTTHISGASHPLPQSEITEASELQISAGIYVYQWTVAGSDLQGSPIADE